MNTGEPEQLKYPVGKFIAPANYPDELISDYIKTITQFPVQLRKETGSLTDEQLDTPYRPGGWTLRQVVHHCADSHMNALIRFKLALTENKPVIKPYMENLFAELADTKTLVIEPSLKSLEGIHERWTVLLFSLNKKDFEKTYTHPEHNKEFSLNEALAQYAWHCNHHLAHITSLKKTKGW
jgi:hypothetical protein